MKNPDDTPIIYTSSDFGATNRIEFVDEYSTEFEELLKMHRLDGVVFTEYYCSAY